MMGDGKWGKVHLRNLTSPKWVKTLVQPSQTLLLRDRSPPIDQALAHRRNRSLLADLNSLKRAQCNICKELRTRRCTKVQERPILLRRLRAYKITILFLKELVSSVLQTSLRAVTEEGRTSSSIDSAETLSPCNFFPGLEVACVELGVDLAPAFD